MKFDLLHKIMHSFLIKSFYSFGIDIANIDTNRLQNEKSSFRRGIWLASSCRNLSIYICFNRLIHADLHNYWYIFIWQRHVSIEWCTIGRMSCTNRIEISKATNNFVNALHEIIIIDIFERWRSKII